LGCIIALGCCGDPVAWCAAEPFTAENVEVHKVKLHELHPTEPGKITPAPIPSSLFQQLLAAHYHSGDDDPAKNKLAQEPTITTTEYHRMETRLQKERNKNERKEQENKEFRQEKRKAEQSLKAEQREKKRLKCELDKVRAHEKQLEEQLAEEKQHHHDPAEEKKHHHHHSKPDRAVQSAVTATVVSPSSPMPTLPTSPFAFPSPVMNPYYPSVPPPPYAPPSYAPPSYAPLLSPAPQMNARYCMRCQRQTVGPFCSFCWMPVQ
jgi:hypothetical protein